MIENYFNRKSIFKNIYLWVLVWLFLVVYYAHSFKSGYPPKSADQIAFFAQLVTDACLGVFSFLAYTRVKDEQYKRFLLFIFISIAVGLFTNETYNILVNIFNIKDINSKINVIWVLPYTIFLLIQVVSWPYLLIAKRSKMHRENKTWVSQFPYILSALLIFLSVIFTGMYKSLLARDLAVVQAANFLLEKILFVLIAICLSRSKNKSLSCLATGFLFLIAFNIAHRFSYILGHYYKTFDMAWLICLIIIIYGLALSIKHKDEKITFFEQNSIHVLTSAIFIIFATLISILFVSLEFLLSSIETNQIENIRILQENTPGILVFTFLVSILISKYIASYFSKPLERISKKVDMAQENQLNPDDTSEETFEIEEIKKLDEFILKTINQLQAANRVKSEFLMNMSHDFRTPASGIHSMSKVIYRKLNDDNLKNLQKLVLDSSKQLLNLLDDVLDYSRLDNDSLKLTYSKINIKELIQEIISFMSSKAEEKKITISAQIPEMPILYSGDKVLLQRALLNIVSNAIKFTEKGDVIISAYEQEISNHQYIIIKVKDSGIGIDPKYHENIFEPFYRVESAETSKYSGVGLGLSSVRLSLNKLGGDISLQSHLGEGSEFTIILPNHF